MDQRFLTLQSMFIEMAEAYDDVHEIVSGSEVLKIIQLLGNHIVTQVLACIHVQRFPMTI